MLSAVSMLSADACAYNGVQATVPSRASVNMQIKYSSMMGGEGLSVLEGAERALNEDFEKPWTAGSDISTRDGMVELAKKQNPVRMTAHHTHTARRVRLGTSCKPHSYQSRDHDCSRDHHHASDVP